MSLNIVILIKLSSLGYHDLRIFLEEGATFRKDAPIRRNAVVMRYQWYTSLLVDRKLT